MTITKGVIQGFNSGPSGLEPKLRLNILKIKKETNWEKSNFVHHAQ